MTPLHFAAENGHSKTVEILVAHNADMNARNDDGDTPAESAYGYPAVIAILDAAERMQEMSLVRKSELQSEDCAHS